MTLSDAGKVTQDLLVRGVIETIITESAVLKHLPFVELAGSALTYNRENVASTVAYRAVNGTWTEDVLTITQVQTALKILGGDADVDEFLQQTYSSPNDIQALAVQNKAKAVAYAFNHSFFYGDSAVDANEFDGLAKIAGAIQTASTALTGSLRAWSNGANGATLTLDMMDRTIDAVKPGKPDVLFMSKRSRRKLSALRRASGNLLEVGVDSFGQRAMYYDGIPIEVDDNIPDTETQGANSDCSSIYAVQFGFNNGVCGLHNGGIRAVKLGQLETKDAVRVRLKWYVGLAVFRGISFVRLTGVRD
jgi:hypothetical protein